MRDPVPSSHNLMFTLAEYCTECPICSWTLSGLSLILVIHKLAQPLLPNSRQNWADSGTTQNSSESNPLHEQLGHTVFKSVKLEFVPTFAKASSWSCRSWCSRGRSSATTFGTWSTAKGGEESQRFRRSLSHLVQRVSR